ncbi:MAG: NAD-dependent epimerase/dehydratase family protein [Bacteroidota bacterium]
MKTLVTGATGFVGGHLVEQLVARHDEVRCFVRPTSDTHWLSSLPVEITVGDFFDERSLQRALNGVQIVYHAAGITKARDKREYWRANLDATRSLLEATLKCSQSIERFVYISTQAAVGPSYNGTPIDEKTVPHPIDVYGRSKRAAEEACLEVAGKLPITIIRPAAVYGPRDHDVFVLFKWLDRGILPIIGSENKRFALIHARDLVEGILAAVEHEQAIGETYLLANQDCPSWGELFSMATQIVGKKLIKCRIPNFSIYVVAAAAEPLSLITGRAALFSFEKARELTQGNWSCDVGKAKRELDFEPKTPVMEGMRTTMEWYRREGWLRRTNSRRAKVA